MRFTLSLCVLLVARVATADDAPVPTPAASAPAPMDPAVGERLRQLEAELREMKAKASVPPPAAPVAPISSLSEGTSKSATRASLTLGGYAELFYQWNFNKPSNGLTNFRGFDNRHNSFTVANAVIDALGTLGPVTAHVVFQYGHTPESYYLAEPFSPGTNAAGTSSAAAWKFLQQANIGYTAPLGRGLLIEAGIFLSPIGPEGMAIKDQWNWSRSTLFFGLPFYHTGLRVSYAFTDRLTASIHGYNGWNSVVDNNKEKSLAAQLTYNIKDKLTFNALYFTGVERSPGSAEGGPWRHLFDTYLAIYPKKWLSLLLHVNGGFEPNAFGTSGWAASALYARVQPLRWLYFAARGDFFYEWVPAGAGSIFWAARWMSSGTLTAELRPIDNVSFRVEYRHDHAAGDVFFKGQVTNDIMGTPIANANQQDTITLGATAWF